MRPMTRKFLFERLEAERKWLDGDERNLIQLENEVTKQRDHVANQRKTIADLEADLEAANS